MHRKNLSFGVHELNLIHVQIARTRISFIFAHDSNEFNEVIRTFTLGTGQLAGFMEGFYGAPKEQWNEADCKNLIGKRVRAEISPARNPNYVNLGQVIEVLKTGGEAFIFQPPKPVTDRESGTHLRKRKKEPNAG